jgi:ABC-type uncharacterized transport system involved in gliding motility auxiliary subunit
VRWPSRRWPAVIVLLAAAVAGVNLAAYRSGAEVDLSANRRFSLAPDSVHLAKAVAAPLRITAFLSSVGGAAKDARFLLGRYHELNRHINFKVADPDTNPGEARRFGIEHYSTVVLTYQGRRVDAPDAEELEISTAILRLLRGGTKTVCALTGHGEGSLTDTAPAGMSKLNGLLVHNAYQPRPLDLTIGSGQVPSDCAAVLVAGPRDPLQSRETDALVAWAKQTGRLMVLASPLTTNDPNPLLAPWGIHFAGGLVIDPARSVGVDQSNVVVEDFPSASPVDDGVTRMQYPAGGGLVVDAGTRGGLTVERLAVTSGQSYVVADPDKTIAFGPGDIPGPVAVAAAADDSRVQAAPGPAGSGTVLRTRLFATGGDGWATNAFIDQLSNRRMLVNALAWLTEQDQLVAATSRPSQDRPLPLTAERRTRVLAITVGLVPGGIVVLGLAGSYGRRRRRRRA